MRVLRTVIKIAMLAMCYPRKKLSLGSTVALQLIGDEHSRHVRQALEQLTEELLRRALIAAALDQDVQHVALLIHGLPEVVTLALDRQKHLIHMPFVTRSGASAPELIGVPLSEFAAPLADGLIGDDYAACKQQFFDITKAQAKAEVQPHSMADDLHRKSVILIFRGGGQCVHAATLTHCVGPQQVDNASRLGGRPWFRPCVC